MYLRGVVPFDMNFKSIDELREQGFEGFVTVSALQKSQCSEVPDVCGVYAVLRPAMWKPEFLRESTGGLFKGESNTIAISILQSRWIEDTLVLNIGKAGPGKSATLRSRLKKYMQFGLGKPVGHRGGRYIWQLHASCDLHSVLETDP